MKAVNSPLKPILGVAYGVVVEIGGWKDPINLAVVPIDDYCMVLEMEFFDHVSPFRLKIRLCVSPRVQ